MAQKRDEDNGHNIVADNFTENQFNDLSQPITETGSYFDSKGCFEMFQFEDNVNYKILANKIRYSSLPNLPATSSMKLIEDNVSKTKDGRTGLPLDSLESLKRQILFNEDKSDDLVCLRKSTEYLIEKLKIEIDNFSYDDIQLSNSEVAHNAVNILNERKQSIIKMTNSSYRLLIEEEENLPCVSKDFFTSIHSCLDSDQVAEPIFLRRSEKFLQKHNFSFFPHNGILFNYCQPKNKSFDNLDAAVKVENEEITLSDADSEELIIVIDCDDIEDKSSDSFYPPVKYETPKQVRETVCTEKFNEQEDSSETESSDSDYSYLNIFEEPTKSGLKKNTFFSRVAQSLTNLFRSKKKNPSVVLKGVKVI